MDPPLIVNDTNSRPDPRMIDSRQAELIPTLGSLLSRDEEPPSISGGAYATDLGRYIFPRRLFAEIEPHERYQVNEIGIAQRSTECRHGTIGYPLWWLDPLVDHVDQVARIRSVHCARERKRCWDAADPMAVGADFDEQ